MERFSRMVVHYPYIILTTVLVFSLICLITPLVTKKFPDFSDPQMGFEARGTILAQRFTAWQNLMESTRASGELVDNPLEYYRYIQSQQLNVNIKNSSLPIQDVNRKTQKGKHKQKGKKKGKRKQQNDKNHNQTNDETKDAKELLGLGNKHRVNNLADNKKNKDHSNDDNFFCNLPTSSYARVVIGADSKETNLWSMEGISAQCHIDGALRANTHFTSLCQTQVERSGADPKCCRSWSPANYVALLSNRSSCLEVTENDLDRVKMLLEQCAYYYHNRQLLPNCAEDANCQRQVPRECYVRNAAYYLLHFLLDVDFIPSHETDIENKQNSTLQSVMLFLPVAASSATLDFYKEIDTRHDDLIYGNIRVQGMQFGLKSTLFDRLLVSDSSLLLAGFVFVTLCIWAYTGSVILTITTIFAVVFSLGISYAMYTLVLRIRFFPFMNFLAIVVAIGIGADDAFIYCKIWNSNKRHGFSDGGLVCLVQETMKHAFPSMFVTSLTTAVAFFASIVSNVTAINCFSLFAGTTVIANFFLMITWLPACVIVSERCKCTLSLPKFISERIIRPLRSFGDKVAAGFTAFLTKIVIGLRCIWILSLGTMTIACCIIVFHYPGLQLPDYIDFQLFDNTHPFEQYDLIFSQRFWFERYEMVGGDASTEILPLRFVWGIEPIDNGDYLDPSRKGTPEWDETFDITAPESQLWLEQFCQNLRSEPFYRNTMGPLLSNCFIESLRSWMQRRCLDPLDPHIDYSPCCESSKFPYEPSVLQQCAAEATAELHRTPSYLWIRSNAAGLKFVKEPPHLLATMGTNVTTKLTAKIKALVVEYDSSYAYTLSFASMNTFFNQVENWMQGQLQNAPRGMQRGWFVSRLEFFELQRTLYNGTIWAIGVSLILALIVLALVTLNPLISLYAIVTVGAAIIVTVAILILLGWKLNVLESVAVSTAIGLAVDFSLHYAVSFKTSITEARIDRVKIALQQMGGPTFMAAITTGAAGALMLPSHVMAYIQIGVFLLLVMTISWIYATLLMCPMLAVAGPSLHFAQFKYPRLKMCFKTGYENGGAEGVRRNNDDRTKKPYKSQGIVSESTQGTSGTVRQPYCTELEMLTVRPPSPSSPLSALIG
ncbi:PREDICTED: protein dispatched isoform X1 [Dinoponera quadriceps]|uniref:Protein dispatched isoform X1 n=1 Tax=Dinoponera quadriceps TaxID=609295 RepID=A0A6P3XC04_DINQU|nr:PREDICTED: protein dispatched isoform X1 [Dinoponera quadriceps]XP_014475790.1 PREDICTED: protein dispatched isoform X1 [Dinoponera quadriceps]